MRVLERSFDLHGGRLHEIEGDFVQLANRDLLGRQVRVAAQSPHDLALPDLPAFIAPDPLHHFHSRTEPNLLIDPQQLALPGQQRSHFVIERFDFDFRDLQEDRDQDAEFAPPARLHRLPFE